jgi:hypothetical protein
MKNLVLFIPGIVLLISCKPFHQTSSIWYVASPDGNLKVEISLDSLKSPVYSVLFNGETVVHPSRLGIALADERHSFLKDLDFEEASD